MRKGAWATVLLMLSVLTVYGEESNPLDLSREILAREKVGLRKAVADMKVFMAIARLPPDRANRCRQAIGRMESTTAMHDLILQHGRDGLMVMSALAVVHGDLERHYAHQDERWRTPEKFPKEDLLRARKQEQSLLFELKVLKEWHGKNLGSKEALSEPVPVIQPDKPLTKRQACVLAAKLASDAFAKQEFKHADGTPVGKFQFRPEYFHDVHQESGRWILNMVGSRGPEASVDFKLDGSDAKVHVNYSLR